MPRPFHLALPALDLAATEAFYTTVLDCRLGRTDTSWIDVDFFGHQLVFHDCGGQGLPKLVNPVDCHQVPIPHFGVVLVPESFDRLATRLTGGDHTASSDRSDRAGPAIDWIIEPTSRFRGTPGEQQTLFFRDPNGYALEFKSFADDRFIFEPFIVESLEAQGHT